jgi:rubredoxin
MKYKCAICGWTGEENELYDDYAIDADGGEIGSNTVCPECSGWSCEKVADDD